MNIKEMANELDRPEVRDLPILLGAKKMISKNQAPAEQVGNPVVESNIQNNKLNK